MPAADDRLSGKSEMLFGAIVGVLGTLSLLLALVSAIDGRYVGRREYDATMSSIDKRLARIEAAVTPAARP